MPSDWMVFIKYDPGFKEGNIKVRSYVRAFRESDTSDEWESEVLH